MEIKILEDGRKVFYIDVGDMTPERAMEYLEKIKKEMKEKQL